MDAFCWLFASLAIMNPAGPDDGLARIAAPELRDHDARSAVLRRELDALPPAPEDHTTARIGWHSTFNFNARRPEARSVVIDLHASEPFEAVVLVPVSVADGPWPGPGYGFPVRFRIEAADEPSFATPLLLADESSTDYPNPGNLPAFIDTTGAHGRYVRVTATRLFSRGAQALFALGELMVWRGATNLAAGKPAVASGSYDNAPTWQLANLNDGQSVLGPPVRLVATPGHGYHSKIAVREDDAKWVQLDLGAPVSIEEIRIFAAHPLDFPARAGFGFPLRFRVEASDTADFAQSTKLVEYRDADCENPGDNPFLVAGAGTTARYVRMTATRLWARHHDFVFALSEMQVFSGGENVARHAVPSALDSLTLNRWSLDYLQDGYTSQGQLIDWAAWLRGLSRRRELLAELARRDTVRAALVATGWRRLRTWATVALASGAVLGLTLMVRQRAVRRRELTRLRSRIAADLHDEIGSNLGSIALLAGMAAEQVPPGARADVAQIQQIAQETAESMRDIVWLMRPGPRAAGDLPARMREVAGLQLAGLDWRMETVEVAGPFTLEFEREVLLLFKEALHNIRKHARARSVSIGFAQTGRTVRLTITDDGQGFDPTATVTGVGLASMRHRAAQLGALIVIRSQPAGGTEIKLEARLP